MLRMDVDQPRAQFAQLGQLHRDVVDKGPALARRGDDARQGGLLRVVEVILLEEGLQSAPLQVEGPLHGAVAGRILHGRTVVLGPQQ